MKKISLLSAILICAVTVCYSQEKNKGFSIDNFSTSIGFTHNQSPGLSINDLYSLAPKSQLLLENNSLLSPGNDQRGYANGVTEAQFQLGLRNNSRSNQRLSFGLTYQQKRYAYNNQGSFSSQVVDTLISQQNNSSYFVDSISSKNIFADMHSDAIRLMASYRFHKNVGTRFSLYWGIGASAGFTFNSQTDIIYMQATGRYVNGLENAPQQGQSRYTDFQVDRESFDNKNSFSLGAFIPMGFDYVIGEWESKVNCLTLFLEVQPGVFSQHIPELSSMISSFYSTQTLGIRIGL